MPRNIKLARKDWPAEDQVMWLAVTSTGHPLDGAGPMAHVRIPTLQALEVAYGRWLAWLHQSQPEVLCDAPAVRATPIRLAGWVDSLAQLAPVSLLTLLDHTVRLLRAAFPEQDWKRQVHFVNTLRRRAKSSYSNRKNGRILSSTVLFDAGVTLAGPTADAARTALAAAMHRRNGTMIAFLTVLPIRRRAFSELTLGQSVHVLPDRIVIDLSGKMTKNGHPWTFDVPELLQSLLLRYINEVRPFLMSRGLTDHDALWVGKKGERMRADSIGPRIGETMLKVTGIRIPPHFFRDAAASTLARHSPQDARLIRPLLAHASYGIAERHYIQAMGIEDGRALAAEIDRLIEGDET